MLSKCVLHGNLPFLLWIRGFCDHGLHIGTLRPRAALTRPRRISGSLAGSSRSLSSRLPIPSSEPIQQL